MNPSGHPSLFPAVGNSLPSFVVMAGVVVVVEGLYSKGEDFILKTGCSSPLFPAQRNLFFASIPSVASPSLLPVPASSLKGMKVYSLLLPYPLQWAAPTGLTLLGSGPCIPSPPSSSHPGDHFLALRNDSRVGSCQLHGSVVHITCCHLEKWSSPSKAYCGPTMPPKQSWYTAADSGGRIPGRKILTSS